MKLKVVRLPGRSISLSTINFVCCNGNAINLLYWPVYHIFHNTDASSPFCLCKRESIESKALKKKILKEVGITFLEKSFRKEILKKKFDETNVENKILGKKF